MSWALTLRLGECNGEERKGDFEAKLRCSYHYGKAHPGGWVGGCVGGCILVSCIQNKSSLGGAGPAGPPFGRRSNVQDTTITTTT